MPATHLPLAAPAAPAPPLPPPSPSNCRTRATRRACRRTSARPSSRACALAHIDAVGSGSGVRPLMLERASALDALGLARVAAGWSRLVSHVLVLPEPGWRIPVLFRVPIGASAVWTLFRDGELSALQAGLGPAPDYPHAADLAIHQIIEILAVPGAVLVGPIPAEIQNYTVYAGALSATPRDAAAAQASLLFLAGAEAAGVLQGRGMQGP